MDYDGARPKSTPSSDRVINTGAGLAVRIVEDKLCEKWLDSLIELAITERSLVDVVNRGRSKLGPNQIRPITETNVLRRVPASRLPGPQVIPDPYMQYPVVVAGNTTKYETLLKVPGLKTKDKEVPKDTCPSLKTSMKKT